LDETSYVELDEQRMCVILCLLIRSYFHPIYKSVNYVLPQWHSPVASAKSAFLSLLDRSSRYRCDRSKKHDEDGAVATLHQHTTLKYRDETNPAETAIISCLFAFVKSETIPENKTVKNSNTEKAAETSCWVTILPLVNLYRR
jgi:hypothetical protein